MFIFNKVKKKKKPGTRDQNRTHTPCKGSEGVFGDWNFDV